MQGFHVLSLNLYPWYHTFDSLLLLNHSSFKDPHHLDEYLSYIMPHTLLLCFFSLFCTSVFGVLYLMYSPLLSLYFLNFLNYGEPCRQYISLVFPVVRVLLKSQGGCIFINCKGLLIFHHIKSSVGNRRQESLLKKVFYIN